MWYYDVKLHWKLITVHFFLLIIQQKILNSIFFLFVSVLELYNGSKYKCTTENVCHCKIPN